MNAEEMEQVEALIRERVQGAMTELARSADWYTSGFGELTGSAAHLLKDAAEMTARNLAPEPEPDPCCTRESGCTGGPLCPGNRRGLPGQDPVNPFAPKRTADQWAVVLKATIAAAKTDGYTVWIDTEDYFGPGPFVKIGTADSPADTDPIICEWVEAK